MGCLDENTIVEFIQGTLSVRDARGVEQHVDHCTACRQLLAEVARGAAKPLWSPDVDQTDEEDLPTDPHASSMAGFRVGQIVAGRYRVLRLIGSGAMGRVYEVDDLQLQDRVALKLLRAEMKNIPRLLQHLKHEVVLGRRITHPNVCRLHDIGTFGGNHFITMSLVPGENLSSVLARGVPPASWSKQVLEQIGAALRAAHEQGVVHRDLKSSNIMVDAQGKVTVMDFGLARDLWGEPSQSGMLIGSPAYWSPEQACGERATERSDIYSFGVVASELFGARRPLIGGKVDVSRIPASYRPVITRCLQVKAEDRHVSVAELQQALRQARRRPGRWSWVVAGAAVLALALAAGLVYRVGQAPVDVRSQLQRKPGTRLAGIDRLASLGPKVRPLDGSTPSPVAPPDPLTPVQDAAAEVRRRRHRPPPRDDRASSVDLQPVAPPAPDASSGEVVHARQMRDRLVSRMRQLEARRVALGVLLEDVPAYTRSQVQAMKSLAVHDTVESKLAVERMSTELDRTRIDRGFIAHKLERLSRLKGSRRLEGAAAREVHDTFARVHSTFFAGDYRTANMHLNRLWQLLNTKDAR